MKITTEANFSIKSVNNTNSNEWNEFLGTTSESTYFTTTDHWQNFENSYFLLVRNNNNEIIAGIPFRMESIIPIFDKFIKFSRIDSSVLTSQKINKPEIDNLKKLTFQFLIKHLRSRGVVFLYISPMARSYDAKVLEEVGFKNDKCATFMINLANDECDIYQSFNKKNRYKIRNAQKNGVQIKFFEGELALPHISDFVTLQDKLFESKKGSYSKLYYKSESFLKKVFTTKYAKSHLAVAYVGDQPIASTIFTSYKNTVFNYIGATDSCASKKSNASNLMVFEIIKYAKQLGCEYNDLGGIPYCTDPSIETHGVYFFKRSFGGERFEYDIGNYIIRKFRYNIIWKLHKNQHRPLFQFGYKLLQRTS